MPIPGPRTQFGPLPGYDNPGRELPNRTNLWNRGIPVAKMGETPGLMFINRRGNVLAAGQIRRLWYQAINEIFAQAPYSWSTNAPSPDRPGLHYPGLAITRALRYMTRSIYIRGGTDNTRFAGLHTQILPRHRSKPVTLSAGLMQARPTVRNRITSFGSRIPPLNSPIIAAEDQQQ